MTTVPIRDLGQYGVITDIDPSLIPPNAFTMGVNARFDSNGISRGPVFRTAGTLVSNVNPRYAVSFRQQTDTSLNELLVCNDDGTVTSWEPTGTGASTETDVTASGWTPSSQVAQAYTSTLINDIVYVNRPDRIPWYMPTQGTQMTPLPVWDPTWLCASLRSVSGQLVALNVTKAGTSYPTMVKTSAYMTYGSYPPSWTADPSNVASENIIADMPEALIDGCVLRDRMMLYTLNYTWIMEPTYDSNVFSYTRLFTNAGIINQNCAIEVNNAHYVFGNDDIWTHDGFQKSSVANKRVRNFIFQNLIRSQAWQFFVYHNPTVCEVGFCYVSGDAYCAFPVGGNYGYPGCNRSAVYNYRSDTWQFDDLPYVRGTAFGSSSTGVTYAGEGSATYSVLGGAYATQTDSSRLSLVTVGPSVSSPALNAAVRSFEKDSSVFTSGAIDDPATANTIIENQYLDMDQVANEIRGYKVISSVYPNARFEKTGSPLMFSFGSADYANSPPPSFSAPMSYDGNINYKLDYMTAGRYLSVNISYSGTTDFLLSGIDLDLTVTGKR